MSELKEKIITEIKKIYDPEIPVNIYELGLIYDVAVKENDVSVKMTLTTPNCPVAESLPKEVKEIVTDFLEMIKEKNELNNRILHDDEKTKLMCLSGVKNYPMRVKCATLSWHTLTSAINNSQEEINSESD